MGHSARARVGFATYFIPDYTSTTRCTEVWDADQARWRLVDAELGDDHTDPTDGSQLDPLDVPRDRFLVAGSAWQACRRGEADPARFLVDPGLDIEDTRGWPYLRHNVVHDLAALNKFEMLLWDGWGLIERERPSERDLQLLDHLAQATSSEDAPFDELRRLYQAEPGLQVPSAVTSYSPAAEAPRTVTLDAPP